MPQKRKPSSPKTSVNDLLDQAWGTITPDQLRATLKRDRAFSMRLSATDRDTMERAAKACGLTSAEYLLRLHYRACIALREAGVEF